MSERILKVNEKIKQEVSRLLATLIDTDSIITVTGVETSVDLKKATVWVSIFGEDEETILAEIEAKKKEIQTVINKNMPAKRVPLLAYKQDHSAGYAQRIEEILRNEKNKR